MSMTTEKMHCIKGPGCFLGDFPAVRRRNAEVPAENGHPAALVNSKDDGMSECSSEGVGHLGAKDGIAEARHTHLPWLAFW